MSKFATRFPEPDRSPGLMLWRTTNAWQRSIRAALEPHGIAHVQFVLLATLASLHPAPVTQRQLADAAATDAMMTSQVVRGLEGRGLVNRRPHPTDGRALLVTPTAEGISVVNTANAAVENADEAFFSAIDHDELDELMNLFAALSTRRSDGGHS